MRQLSSVSTTAAAVTVLVGAFLCASSSTAFAAPGKEGTRQAATPTNSSSGDSSDSGNTSNDERQAGFQRLPQTTDPDLVQNQRVDQKAWEVGGGFEAHHLIAQSDVEGYAQYKQFNVLGFYAQYDLTQYDRFRASGFVYEYFLADSGETGFRFDDIILQYTRRVPLPKQFTFRASARLSIPTSYDSQRQSNITTPHVGLSLDKKFGRFIDVSGNAGATYFIDHYAEADNGGGVNPRASISMGLSAEITMPFHEPLSIGADIGTGYTWFYQPNNTSDGNMAVQTNGATADPQYSSQPISQTYFGEVYLRYVMPTLFGIRSDILVAYADGDPTIGNVSVLHEGVGHFYGFYRYSSEVYAALSASY